MTNTELNGSESGPENLQLINGDQEFSDQVGDYMDKKWNLVDRGFDYNVCAVFGSQSTGKSTLLNKLFGTSFATMEENSRQQTTKGIWISKGVGMNVLVMDVEGTDGRERGEDQDFERKSALFSLATAEVLIVNLWENMVGLYNGANMGLLKTVFEVNLQLFQKKGKEKTLLFFVIRDFIGNTPLENLSRTLTTDLERIWGELAKPEGLEGCSITDFFDYAFTALPHKLLMPEKFDANVAELRTRFVNKELDNYVFKPRYHKHIPADGFPHYASSIWEKIMTNRDLDLPTQQELLAQYRCDEILNAAFAEFSKSIKPFQRPIELGKVINELGPDITRYRDIAIESFDKNASRYHQEVYKRKREEILSKCHSALHILFLGQLKNMHKHATQRFGTILQERLGTEGYDFLEVVTDARQIVLEEFTTGAQAILLSDTEWTFDVELDQLKETLDELASQRRADEINKMITTYEKSMRKEIEELVGVHLNAATPDMWKELFDGYQEVELAAEKKLTDRAQRFGSTEAEQKDCVKQLRQRDWESLHKKVSDELADNMILVKLRNRLEDKFRYDEQGLPRVWKPEDDMDSYFQKAKDEAFKLIPLYARMDFTKSSLNLEEHFADNNEFDYQDTLTIYTASKQQEIKNRFRREAEAMYLEAKRSMVSTEAKIPYWMVALVCMLGWNEFLTIISSPMYLVLFMMLSFVGYVIWMLNLTGPVERIARGMAMETARVITGQLSNALQRPAVNKGEEVPMKVIE